MLRQLFEGGPAYLTTNGITHLMHEDWTAEPDIQLTERMSSVHGNIGRGLKWIAYKISGKAIATSANLAASIAKLRPYRASHYGKLITDVAGNTDLPAVIQGANGRSITFAAAFLTKEPDMNFAPNVDLFDNFEYTVLLAVNGDSADIGDYVTEAPSAWTEPTLNPLTIISECYLGAWGIDAPFNAIETEESGFKLTSSLTMKECITSVGGLLNYRIGTKTSQVQYTPVNFSAEDIIEMIPAVGRGKMLATAGLELTIEQVDGVGGPKLVAPLAAPITPSAFRFGQESRAGQVTMQLERKFTTSLLEPYTLSVTTAP